MALLTLDRTPEPEVMGDEGEAAVYESQAAEAYLAQTDARFITRVLAYEPAHLVVDIGAGPGQIAVALAARRPALSIVGVDLSDAMLVLANRNAERAGVADRVQFLNADARCIPLAAQCADIVICNSTLHHFADPVAVFDEACRLLRPGGRAVIRDLRRPSRLACASHITFFGRRYRGRMRELFGVSVRAAYTVREVRALLARSGLTGAQVFREGLVHLVAVGRRPGGDGLTDVSFAR